MEKDTFKVLNKIFTDEEFLLEAATICSINDSAFSFDKLASTLNTVLNYYLATRDHNLLTRKEVENNYGKIKNNLPTKEHLNNILIDGYLTHSFSGSEKKYIQNYGFDFFDKLPLDEKNKLQIVRDKLLELEKSMGSCRYISDRMHENSKEIVERELFMTFPGTKTIYYSIFTPERLYRGPINMYMLEEFPIIVGETKKDYLMRIIKYRAQRYSPKVPEEKIASLANIVLDFYCKESSCIAFICIQNFLENHIPLFTEIYNSRYHDKLNIYYEMMKSGKYYLKDIFTSQEDDLVELCDIGNLVTLSSYIDKSTTSLVDFPDWYNLRQAFLKKSGIPEGTMIDYSNCMKISDENYDILMHDDVKKHLYKDWR